MIADGHGQNFLANGNIVIRQRENVIRVD